MDPHYNDHDPYAPDQPMGPPPGFDDHFFNDGPDPHMPQPGFFDERPYEPQETKQDSVPYFLSSDWEGNHVDREFQGSDKEKKEDEKEKKGLGKPENGYGGIDYHFKSQDGLGIYSSLLTLAQATADTALELLKFGIKKAKTQKELDNYEKLYQKVLKNPENYSVFHIEGNAMEASEFSRVLKEDFGIKADVFETMDNTILVSRKDQEKILKAADEISKNPDAFLGAQKNKDSNRKNQGEEREASGEAFDQAGNRKSSGTKDSQEERSDEPSFGIDDNGEVHADKKRADTRAGRKHKRVGTYGKNQDALHGKDEEEADEERLPGSGRTGSGSNNVGSLTRDGRSAEEALAGTADFGAKSPDTAPADVRGDKSDDRVKERKGVGTRRANEDAISKHASVAGTGNSGLANVAGRLDNVASTRTKVFSMSQINVQSKPEYHSDLGRSLYHSTDRLQVAAISMGGTMISSAGRDDPTIGQFRSTVRNVRLMKDAATLLPGAGLLSSRGEARAAQLALNRNYAKMDAATFNALSRYTGSTNNNEITKKLINRAAKEGSLKRGIGGDWDINYTRLGNEIFGPNATKSQIKALKTIGRQEERRRINVRSSNSKLKNVAGRAVSAFSQMDDSTKAMSIGASYVAKGLSTGLKAGKWAKHRIATREQRRIEKLTEKAAKAANPYQQRFRVNQRIIGERKRRGNVGESITGTTTSAADVIGSDGLTNDTLTNPVGQSAKKELSAKTAAPTESRIGGGKKRTLHLRQSVEGGGVSNAVSRNHLKLATQGLSRLRNTKNKVKGAISASPIGKAGRALGKVRDFAVTVTDPIRFIINLPKIILKKVASFMAKAFIIYALCTFVLLFLINMLPAGVTALGMYVSNKWEGVKEFINEVSNPAPTDSIAGAVYSELRYAEIAWASTIRSYGTNVNTKTVDDSKERYQTYGNGLLVSDLLYTDQNFTLEEYLNSSAGVADYLGAFAVSNEEYKDDYLTDEGAIKEDVTIGVQGPQPFTGALLNDYKLITAIDGGNQLEIVGKPMDGWTSNAKEVISMSIVYYQQLVETIEDDSTYTSGVQKAWTKVKDTFKSMNDGIASWGLGLISELSGAGSWSWSGIVRNYAYPLFVNARYEDFYLSTYIYPTYWTEPNIEGGVDPGDTDGNSTYNSKSTDARYDENQEVKTPNAGDKALNAGQDSGGQKSHSTVGNSKSGGSGKVNAENKVSKNYYNGVSSYETYDTAFESCYDAVQNYDSNGKTPAKKDEVAHVAEGGKAGYNGYGCILRYSFSQKWLGTFGTDIEGNLENEEGSGITKLHYGEADDWNDPNEGDVEEETDPDNNDVMHRKDGQDVSTDVSPYWEEGDIEAGYNVDSCLVHPIKMSGIAWSCWEWDDPESFVDSPSRALKDYEFDYDDINHALDLADTDSYEEGDWKLDKIEIAEDSAETGKVYIWTYQVHFETWTDENGNEHTEEAESEEVRKYTITHDCTGKHEGTYCGGHAQLRTRGVVLGFSDEQVSDGNPVKATDTSKTSNYDPKFLDPDSEEEMNGLDSTKYGDAVDVYGDPIEVFDSSSEKYSNFKIPSAAVVSTKVLAGTALGASIGSFFGGPIGTGIGGFIGAVAGYFSGLQSDAELSAALTGIDEDGQEYIKQARDIFDIDVLIKRPSDFYLKESSAGIEWQSWTLTNMGQAISLALQDWNDLYQVPDTQTIVGGQIGENHIDDDTEQNVLDQIGLDDVEIGLTLSSGDKVQALAAQREYPVETKTGVVINNIAEEVQYINRLRHVRYALGLVGNVSYNQDMHTYLWANLSGHQTDCSGFVSNIWRDAIGLTGDTGALSTYALYRLAVDNDAWHSLNGTSIAENITEEDGIKPGDIILKDSSGGETDSAHALIFVGMLDETEMYADRDQDAIVEEKGFSYETTGDGLVKAYTVDCSTMMITTTTYADNVPNKFLLDISTDSKNPTVINKLGSTNTEPTISGDYSGATPGGGLGTDASQAPQKVRSGNARFAARPYLQDTISGDIGYIDMEALGEALGNYVQDKTTGVLTTGNDVTGLLIWDFSNMQILDETGLYPTGNSDTSKDNPDADKTVYTNDYATAASDTFWSMTTSKGAKEQGPVRNTVVIEAYNGKPEEEAKIEIENPSDPEDPGYSGDLPDGSGAISVDPNTPGAVQIGDKWYYWERQGEDIWRYLQSNSYNSKTGRYTTAGGYACGFYALQSALSAITGKVWTFQDVVELAFPGVKLDPKTGGYAAGSKRVDDWAMSSTRLNNILAAIGASYSSYNVGSTANSKSKLDSELSQGKVVTVRTTNNWDPNGALHSTSGNGHWVTIVGTTVGTDGRTKYICLGNQASGGHPILVDASSMPSKYESMITYNYSPSKYDTSSTTDTTTSADQGSDAETDN